MENHRKNAPTATEDSGRVTFPDWAVAQIDRILEARNAADSPEDRAQLDLKLAVLCHAARRYGLSLAENSDW